MNVKLHLTDDTQLRAHGFVAGGAPIAEVAWDFPIPGSRLGDGTLWGTPAMLRRLAELAVQAATQAEEEACWHAHQAATSAAEGGAAGMNPLLDAALGYAARGIPVYPVHWPRPGWGGAGLGCSCPRGGSCDRPGKHPLVRHGVKDATTNPAQLERWWQRWPQANLGLATGIIFDALDVDGLQGKAALRQYAPTVGWRHPGPLVATGGGGWHYWYAPSGLGNRPPRGLTHVDWRGLGGSVLAPPSRHVTGGRYRWLRGLDQAPLPEVPAPLRALVEPAPSPGSLPGPTRPAELGHPYARQALAAELAILRQAGPRTRNRTLNRCAFKVYRYVAGGLLDEQQVTFALTTVARSIGLGAAEVRRTLTSASTAARAFPRGLPARPTYPQEGGG